VINMSASFYLCDYLAILDVSNWDVSNVTDMRYLFIWNYKLETLDVRNWDVSNVSSLHGTFRACNEMTSTQMGVIKDWTITSLTTAAEFMYDCDSSMSTPDYSELLIRWEEQGHEPDVTIDFNDPNVDSTFTLNGFELTASEARDSLVADGWTVDDGDGTHSP